MGTYAREGLGGRIEHTALIIDLSRNENDRFADRSRAGADVTGVKHNEDKKASV